MTIENAPHVYDLVIIGRGTSAAAYLRTLRTYHRTSLEPELPPLEILVIGNADPWAGARGYSRGHYTQNINQARQLVDHGRGAKASMSQAPVDRVGWSDENADIIREISGNNVLDAEVSKVECRQGSRDVFIIRTLAKGDYCARKVVIAAGAGIETNDREYHHVPPEVGDLHRDHSDKVMDLDVFQKNLGFKGAGGKSVAIMGPNAGTDAVMEAATRGFAAHDVYWLIPTGRTPGTALTWDVSSAGIKPTFTAEEAGKDRSDGGTVYRYDNISRVEIAAGKVKITTNKGAISVDYLVYAVGQRGGGINRAEVNAGSVKHVPFLDGSLAKDLEPIYDLNQRYADFESGGAWQHVVGIQLVGSSESNGIEIVGSAASQASRKVDHNYLDRDYDKLAKDLAPFEDTAAKNGFPELFAMRKFADMCKADLKEDSVYEQKVKRFLVAATSRARRSSQVVLGNADNVHRPQGRREQIVSETDRKLSDLCHMFVLRIKAARYVGQNGDKKVSGLLSEGLGRSLPTPVSDNRLIGGLERNIEVNNEHHNVQHIRTELGVNFLEDQQTLALYVAVHYPNIKPKRANELVSDILKERKDKMRGFSLQEITEIDAKLIRENSVPAKERWVTTFKV